MQHYSDNVQDLQGNARVGVSVSVYSGASLATIYADNGNTVKANPMTSGAGGAFDFYAANGDYTISVGNSSKSVTLFDVLAAPTATPTSSDTVVGVQGGVVKRFAYSAFSGAIEWLRAATGAVATTLAKLLGWQSVTVFEFMTEAQVIDARTGAPSLDSSAALAAAIASLSDRGGTVKIPSDCTLAVATPPTWYNGVVLEGESSWSSRIKYTGTSGILCDIYGISRGGVKRLGLFTDGAGTTQAIRVYGVLNTIEDVYIDEWTASGGNGWSIGWTVEGSTDLQYRSASNVIRNVYCNAVRTVEARLTRAVDTFISECRGFSIQDSTTAVHLEIETGASGVYMDRASFGYGKNGVAVKHSISTGTGPYNVSPEYIFADEVLCDTTTGGDGWIFDTTLGSNVTSFVGTNCWAAGAGLNAAGTVVTAGANGIAVNGGRGIEWHGRARSNAANGAIVNDADCTDVCFKGIFTGNNKANSADAHGIYAAVCGVGFRVIGARSGNTMDAGGFQKYGVKLSGSVGADWSVIGCNLSDNVTGPLLNSTTTAGTATGNTPSDSTLDNVFGGRLRLGGLGFVHSEAQAVASGATLTPTFAINGGELTVRNYTDGGVAKFLIDATGIGSGKLSGAGSADIVYGVPGANQLGVSSTGVITNNYAASKNIAIFYTAAQ